MKKTKLFSVTLLAFLVVAVLSNYQSLQIAKNACIDNDRTPQVEQSPLAFNWSVSCE
jgi:hypothetical protein